MRELYHTCARYLSHVCDKLHDRTKRFIRENGEINGRWTGERGNSEWIPNPDKIPGTINRDNLSWEEISSKYGGEIRIPFIEGEPDFSRYAESTVIIPDFTGERATNFAQADEAEALKRGCQPQEVAEWRKEHNITWHERGDCKTMDLMPNEIHGNIPHSGGISQIKALERWNG